MDDSRISEICSLTGVSPTEAKKYLEIANGDASIAASLILDGGDGGADNSVPAPRIQQNNPTPVLPSSNTGGAPSKPAPSTFGRIVGFSDVKKEPNDDDQRDSYFAGGEKSGIAILDPTAKRDIVKQVFDSAKQHGAVEKHELPPEEKEKFGGTGYSLGSGQAIAPTPKPPGPKTVKLTFWKDCFSIDEGEPRKFSDPNNAAFLSDVQKGVVPRELRELAQGSDLNIELIQKNEEYKAPPKPKAPAFSGTGYSLGSDTPIQNTGSSVKVSKVVIIDESQPTTNIQIVLHNRQKIVQKFNHTHTIGDIKSHIETVHPSGGKSIELRLSYPNKILNDDSVTIKDAGLLNASLNHRIL